MLDTSVPAVVRRFAPLVKELELTDVGNSCSPVDRPVAQILLIDKFH